MYNVSIQNTKGRFCLTLCRKHDPWLSGMKTSPSSSSHPWLSRRYSTLYSMNNDEISENSADCCEEEENRTLYGTKEITTF